MARIHSVGGKTKSSRLVRSTKLYKEKARSRITNGKALLPNVDQRTFWVRRLRDLLALHIADMGGDDAVSEAERCLARRAAVITVELERREMLIAGAGAASDKQLEVYQRSANSLRRLHESLGLQRRTKPVPTLTDYFRTERVLDGQAEAAE